MSAACVIVKALICYVEQAFSHFVCSNKQNCCNYSKPLYLTSQSVRPGNNM